FGGLISDDIRTYKVLYVINVVNGDPPRTARSANYHYQLLHTFPGSHPGQRKSPDLLHLFTRHLLHSRDSNLAKKKTSASTISTFCVQRLLEDDIGKTGIGTDGWRMEERATVDGVGILANDFVACCMLGL